MTKTEFSKAEKNALKAGETFLDRLSECTEDYKNTSYLSSLLVADACGTYVNTIKGRASANGYGKAVQALASGVSIAANGFASDIQRLDFAPGGFITQEIHGDDNMKTELGNALYCLAKAICAIRAAQKTLNDKTDVYCTSEGGVDAE